jgi:hypothetical protein
MRRSMTCSVDKEDFAADVPEDSDDIAVAHL